MTLTVTLLAIYLIGCLATAAFNLAIIIGPVARPFVVLRNAVFWPVFLPLLIIAGRT